MSAATAEHTTRTYYSTCPGLSVRISKGQNVVNTAGQQERQGEKFADFVPLSGSGKTHSFGRDFGHLTTDDPEVIAWMDAAIAKGRSDILTPQQFNHASTSPEDREKQLAAQNSELQRKLTEQNELLQKIMARDKAASTK